MGVLNTQLKRLVSGTQDIGHVILLLWFLIALGILSLLVPATVKALNGDWAGALTVVGTGLWLEGAAILAGSVVGFLFGIPLREPKGGEDQDAKPPGNEGYRPNTNLEQISDWLTKIIVGIGLTQFRSFAEFFAFIGSRAGPAFGDKPSGEVIAICIVISYTLLGFFNGFLLAYLWLPGAFSRATKSSGDEPPQNNSGAEVAGDVSGVGHEPRVDHHH